MFDEDVIRSVDKALVESDSLAVLRGNLAPDGAVIKPPAAEAQLHQHTGKAVVFADYNDMAARIDDPDVAGGQGLRDRAEARGAAGRAGHARSGASCRSRRSC